MGVRIPHSPQLVENELVMMDRVDMIKNICGVDLLKAVAQKKSNEEE